MGLESTVSLEVVQFLDLADHKPNNAPIQIMFLPVLMAESLKKWAGADNSALSALGNSAYMNFLLAT